MQLGRTQVSTLRPPPILSITFSQDGRHFAVAAEAGYEVYRTYPLSLVKRRVLPGTLGRVVLLPGSPLVILQGGGVSPLYPPNKAIIYHDGLGIAVAELEFGERVRGIAVRRSTICIALLRKVVAFEYGMGTTAVGEHKGGKASGKGKEKEKVKEVVGGAGSKTGFWVRQVGEWQTAKNEQGLLALATERGSTLFALPGRQPGHVQLVSLTPCPGPKAATTEAPPRGTSTNTGTVSFRSPILLAHTHPLSTLACSADGSYLLTASERGTLLRVWDTSRGRLERELRRGVDPAEMWGATFSNSSGGSGVPEMSNDPAAGAGGSGPGGRIAGWSDKGTIHIWGSGEEAQRTKQTSNSASSGGQSLTKLISRNLPLPKYFSSSASTAQYRLPRKNPHAFASTIGAAAAASGVPSMRLSDSSAADEELAERFVLGWVQVEVDVEEVVEPAEGYHPSLGHGRRGSTDSVRGRSSGQGTGRARGEHRRSFGSEDTSRTATPSAGRAGTPAFSRQTSRLPQVPSVGGSRTVAQQAHPSPGPKRTRFEQHLIAITYAGDWYRLRVPHSANRADTAQDDAGTEGKARSGKCELVEYRRFTVGGDGW